MSKIIDAIVALAGAIEGSEVECVKVEVHKGGAERNPSCVVHVYATNRQDDDFVVGAGKGKTASEAAVAAVDDLARETGAKAKAASKLASLGTALALLVACLFMPGCVSAATEAAITTNHAAFDGMVRTIEGGVVTPDGSKRALSYDELVQYVYAGRFGMAAVAYAAGVTDVEPNREALAPRGGWIVAPIAPADQPRGWR